MKKKWYRSAGWKTFLLLFAYTAAGVIAAAALLLAYMWNLGILPVRMNGALYEASEYVTDDIAEDAIRIMNYLSFLDGGTDGSSDSGNNSSASAGSADGVSQQSMQTTNKGLLGTNETTVYIGTGDEGDTADSESTEDSTYAADGESTVGSTYAADGESTVDDTNAVDSAYSAVDDPYMVREARVWLNTYFRADVTNLTYLYVDRTAEKIYTNRDAYQSYDDYQKSIKSILDGGTYFVIYPESSSCQTDLPGWNSDAAQDLECSPNLSFETVQITADEYFHSEDYIFAVRLDTSYGIQDSYSVKSWNYNGLTKAGTYRYVLPALVLSVLVFVITVVWLTIVAGRKSGDEELHLNFYDHVWTEVFLLISALSAAGVLYFAVTGFFQNFDLSDIHYGSALKVVLLAMAGIGVMAAVVSSVFYLSLVRRIKGRNLYRDSLLRRILALLGRLGKAMRDVARLYSRNTSQKLLLTGGMILLPVLMGIGCLLFIGSGDAVLALSGLLVAGVLYLAAFRFVLREADGQDRILEGLKRISGGELTYKIPTEKLLPKAKQQAEYINHIGEGLDAAVAQSMKDERMKTELITNVSHDLKTPLTSIINYVELLKRENFEDPKIQEYLKILEEKSQRLKVLTEDVVEASKASTGNLALNMTELDLTELLRQVMAEVGERLEARNLTLVVNFPEEPSLIRADGQRLWRVLENVFVNASKYAMEGTRVYAEIQKKDGQVLFTLKNISAQPLNFSADELTERFIRGDVSRGTEGSGLGLSIAKSLTELMEGKFTLYLDGDLFKVTVAFAEQKTEA